MNLNDLVELFYILLTVGSWVVCSLLAISAIALILVIVYVIGKEFWEDETDLIVATILCALKHVFD